MKDYISKGQIIATIKGKINGLHNYLMIASPQAVETIKQAEIEVRCLEGLLKQIEA